MRHAKHTSCNQLPHISDKRSHIHDTSNMIIYYDKSDIL